MLNSDQLLVFSPSSAKAIRSAPRGLTSTDAASALITHAEEVESELILA